MAQFYSNPSRENDTTALPDAEVFYSNNYECYGLAHGWYYWFCFPGCLPDSEPYGPFDSEAEAIKDCREAN